MRLAFYAPMKPPDDPVPSGDRNIARGLVAALEHAGAEVVLASRFRSREGRGDAARQEELIAAAEDEIGRVVEEGRGAGWQAWVTYHNYYKAPDLIGPAVSAALGIPYVQIESTRARKRLEGPWAAFALQAEAAADAAQSIFYFSERDAEALRRDAPERQRLLHLRPFLNRQALPAVAHGSGILSVGMMREGDKLSSYRIIAETLGRLDRTDWQLRIVGDGPARGEVETLMRPFGDRVRFLGQLEGAALEAAYAEARMFLWPGVNEALGLVYLEAQAAGLAVVAQDRPGMRDVLAPGRFPAEHEGAEGLAKMIAGYLEDDMRQNAAAMAARAHVEKYHLLPAAAVTLREGLAAAGVQI